MGGSGHVCGGRSRDPAAHRIRRSPGDGVPEGAPGGRPAHRSPSGPGMGLRPQRSSAEGDPRESLRGRHAPRDLLGIHGPADRDHHPDLRHRLRPALLHRPLLSGVQLHHGNSRAGASPRRGVGRRATVREETGHTRAPLVRPLSFDHVVRDRDHRFSDGGGAHLCGRASRIRAGGELRGLRTGQGIRHYRQRRGFRHVLPVRLGLPHAAHPGLHRTPRLHQVPARLHRPGQRLPTGPAAERRHDLRSRRGGDRRAGRGDHHRLFLARSRGSRRLHPLRTV